MNIQEAAAVSGLTPDTIRFYERKGVLPRPPRRTNGYRNYTGDHVLILRLAKGLRHLSVALDDLVPIIAVAHDGTCGEVRHELRETLERALAETEKQLHELSHVRNQLSVILRGLTSMPPSDIAVPGMTPCECIRLVSAAADE